MPHVTLKMIAKEAGMTVATVSMALRHHPVVAKATRERIQVIAQRLGYRNNPHVSALMSQVRQARPISLKSTLAIIHTFPKRMGWEKNEPTRRIVTGIKARCAQLGYSHDMLWYQEPNISPARLSHILRARGIHGIVFVPWPQHLVELQVEWSPFATATVNYNVSSPLLHCVAEDFFGNVCLAYLEFQRRGLRRIGLVCKSYHEPESQHRIVAAYMRQRSLDTSRGMPEIPPLVLDDWNRQDVLDWYYRHQPDAIITLDWDIGRWLPHEGIHIPDTVSVALLNQCPNYGAFSGVDPNYELMGAAAVDLVAEQINNNEYGLPEHPKEVLIRGKWAEGTMVCSPPTRRPTNDWV